MLRRLTSIRHTLLVAIGGLTLLIALLVAQGVWRARQRLAEVQVLRDASLVSDALFSAGEHLSSERGIAVTLLHVSDATTIDDLRPGLEDSRRGADGFLEKVLESLHESRLPELQPLVAKIEARLSDLRGLRSAVDRDTAAAPSARDPQLPARCFREITALIEDTQDLWLAYLKHYPTSDSVLALLRRFRHVVLILNDYVGREQAVIGRVLVTGTPPTREVEFELLQWHGKIELGWMLAETLASQSGSSPALATHLSDAESHYATVYDIVREVVHRPAAPGATFPIDVAFWLELSSQVNSSVSGLRRAALVESRDYRSRMEAESRRAITVQAAVFLFAVALCMASFHVITRRVLAPIQGMVAALLSATRGEFVAFVPAAGEPDEIDKLARVLHAFRRNSEEIRRGASELQRHATALEHSNRELDDFAYIASHDLKEPLRGIHNHSRFLLEDNQDKLDPDSVKRLSRLVHLTQHMEHLINDLLYFSRLGRQELAIGPTDLNPVVADIEMTLEVFLDERGARISVPRALPTITCDRTRVAELFRNLITNAIKYNDAPEKIVEITYEPAHPLPDGTLAHGVFCVRDNGRGIEAQFHDDIFRIFKRLQASEGSEDGTGVGLTFVKKIVERHGGRIWIESELGKGSAFYFTLEEESDDHRSRRAA